jgi:hypothetical protein
MTRPLLIASTLLSLSLTGIGCSSGDQGTDTATTTGFRAQLAYGTGTETLDDVVAFRFLISRLECAPGDGTVPNTQETFVDVFHQSNATGQVSILNLFDDGSNHRFADLFFFTEVGCYSVTAEPLSALFDDGSYTPSALCSAATSSELILVESGKTIEITPLISQCNGDDDGAIDTPVVLNHPPGVWADEVDNHGYVCEPAELCVQAKDADNDALEFVWSQVGGPELFSELVVQPADTFVTGGIRIWRQCIEFGANEFGSYEFEVTVYDQNAEGERIEDTLGLDEHGEVQYSHDTLKVAQSVGPGREDLCVDLEGELVAVNQSGLPLLPECEGLDPAEFYCDPVNAERYGFDRFSTCPFEVFNPVAVYPLCGRECVDPGEAGCPCSASDECEEGLYCYFTPGECGGLGVCLTPPELATTYINVNQVCACSGTTYESEAQALHAGESIRDLGPCPGDEGDDESSEDSGEGSGDGDSGEDSSGAQESGSDESDSSSGENSDSDTQTTESQTQ